jgi:hypothetical protein
MQTLRRIKAEFCPSALRVRLRFPAALLRRRFEGAETADLFQNAFGIQLILQPLQGAIYGLPLAYDHFGHGSIFS